MLPRRFQSEFSFFPVRHLLMLMLNENEANALGGLKTTKIFLFTFVRWLPLFFEETKI